MRMCFALKEQIWVVAMDWIVCSPKFECWILNYWCDGIGGRAFGRLFSWDEVLIVGPSWWDQGLYKKSPLRTSSLSLSHSPLSPSFLSLLLLSSLDIPPHHMWGHSKERTVWAKKRVPTRNTIDQHLDLGHVASGLWHPGWTKRVVL